MPQAAEDEYLAIEKFVEEYNHISYVQLDNYTTQKVNLFALPERERFVSLEYVLDKIIAALPSLKRILAKPITRLKEVSDILPVEAVRVINNRTMGHISLHTELWGDITREGLKPRKLMTVSNQEEYKIYENLLFARLMNGILAFVKKNIRLIQDILYSCQSMQVNLLERTNHLMYFLAIGKLHVGYAHAQDAYLDTHQRCLEKLLFIDKTLRAKLHAPVYKICSKDTSKLPLKKTNIFRLQKDYRQVYALWKLFSEQSHPIATTQTEISEKAYADYCTLLSLFSAGHFHFLFPEKEKLHFSTLSSSCQFKEWKLRIERVALDCIEGLLFCITKEKEYRICLLFYRNEKIKESTIEKFKNSFPADEYLWANPVEYGKKESIYLNLFEINSFRRIQQFLLRGMVYADEKRDTCPFCGGTLTQTAEGYTCALCKTQITKKVCPEQNKTYFTTALQGYRVPKKEIFSDKEKEGIFFYRNITPLSSSLGFCCPHCGKVHVKK